MKTVGVVCHDAGGAEVVSSWLLQTKVPFLACLKGPAVSIFKKKIDIENIMSITEVINQSDWLLCGTSWQSDIEKKAIELALKMGKFSVAFLDHWINYEDRFKCGDHLKLPDEIWVCDEYAKKIASRCFPKTKLKLIPNPYYKDLNSKLFKIMKKTPTSNIDILYVCEPIREHCKLKYGDEEFLGYTEEDALNYFFQNLAVLPIDPMIIVVRPHPSEPLGKYNWVKKYHSESLTIRIGRSDPLIDEVARSKLIVGCESMAMIVGLLAEKIVFSSIPPSGRPCVLPHTSIKSIAQQVAVR